MGRRSSTGDVGDGGSWGAGVGVAGVPACLRAPWEALNLICTQSTPTSSSVPDLVPAAVERLEWAGGQLFSTTAPLKTGAYRPCGYT